MADPKREFRQKFTRWTYGKSKTPFEREIRLALFYRHLAFEELQACQQLVNEYDQMLLEMGWAEWAGSGSPEAICVRFAAGVA